MSASITSLPFKKLVQALKHSKKTCTAIEQCCGGVINSSILAQPGASSVYLGGSVIYNTKKGKSLLFNNEELHSSLTNKEITDKESYIQSKVDWTAKTSVAFCKELNTDYAIAEGGAAGPTFRFDDMDSGFAVLSIAGRKGSCNRLDDKDGEDIQVLKQKVIHSTHSDREQNMKAFANAAADLMLEVIKEGNNNIGDKLYKKEVVNEFQDDDSLVTFDRATKLRREEVTLAEMEKSPQARYVLVKGSDILVHSASKLAMLSYDDVAHLKNNQSNNNRQTFLGLLRMNESKIPVFGIDILDEKYIDTTFERFLFVNARTSAPLLPSIENELALHMMAYANWQRKSCFCSSCGAPLTLIHAGTAQQCTSCNVMSWPRQDPSMIASITSRCGERILLARSKRHPPKMHTVLAGFVEAGETFEAAVTREVWEETGIRIDQGSVQYIGSQPWPFPQSCMIAFTATADDKQELNIDEDEIVEASWFHKEDVLAATKVDGAVMQYDVAVAALYADPSLTLLIPPKRVIARTLIDRWLGK
jgi:NAD+ diphosphatase